MRYSGLALRDAVTPAKGNLQEDGSVVVRRAKTDVRVSVPLQSQVREALASVADARIRHRLWFWIEVPAVDLRQLLAPAPTRHCRRRRRQGIPSGPPS